MQAHQPKAQTCLLTCDLCGKNFSYLRNLKLHLLRHRKNEPELQPKCDQCGRTFKTNRGYKIHRENIHGNENVKYTCSKCSEVFTIRKKFQIHMSTHEPEQPCEYCGVLLPPGYLFNEHIKKHQKKLTQCPYPECGKLLARGSYLSYHIETMHKVQTTFHECKLCGTQYNLAKKLIRHMYRQHGEKLMCPFPACSYGTTYKDNLKLHCKNTHRKADPELRARMMEKIKSMRKTHNEKELGR